MNKDYLDLAFGKPGVHRWFIKKEDGRLLFGWLSIWNGNCHTGVFQLDQKGLEDLIRVMKLHCQGTYEQLLYAYKYGSHRFIDEDDDLAVVKRLPRGKFTLDNFHEEFDQIGDVFTSEQEFRSKALELI